MSYYTTYDLSVQGIRSKEDYNELTFILKQMEIINYAIAEDLFIQNSQVQHFPCLKACNWFSSDTDMIALSKHFPNYTFKLHGLGERNEDVWDTYYYNGESELCMAEIVFPKPKSIYWDDKCN